MVTGLTSPSSHMRCIIWPMLCLFFHVSSQPLVPLKVSSPNLFSYNSCFFDQYGVVDRDIWCSLCYTIPTTSHSGFRIFLNIQCLLRLSSFIRVPQFNPQSIGDIIRRHGLKYHLYADDTQLYHSFKPIPAEQAGSIAKIEACVPEIDS